MLKEFPRWVLNLTALNLMIPLAIYVYATVYMRWMAADWCLSTVFASMGILGD